MRREFASLPSGLAVALVVGCAPPSASPPLGSASVSAPRSAASSSPDPELAVGSFRLDFDENDVLTITGPSRLTASIIPINGGNVRRVPSPDGQGIGFPAESSAPDPPGAMVLIEGADLPNPGSRSFSFGADVRLDATSTSDTDDGDNVLQRGRFDDPSQLKLQVDRGEPSCLVRGTNGSAIAKSRGRLGEGWYRLRCDRVGDTLTLTVEDLESPMTSAVAIPATAPLGEVVFKPQMPLSIGRKASSEGAPTSNQPDQFNGALDAVWVSIDECLANLEPVEGCEDAS